MLICDKSKVHMQVEDYFRTTRQQVFKLDEVTASQRAAVYSQVSNLAITLPCDAYGYHDPLPY